MQKMILLRIITIYRVTLATIYRVTLATEPHAVLKVLTTNKTHTFLDPNYRNDITFGMIMSTPLLARLYVLMLRTSRLVVL